MKFFHIYQTRIRVLFSDKLFILAILFVPVLLSLITGYAQRKEKLGFVPIVLVDEDKSARSEVLCKRLLEKEGLRTVFTERDKALIQLKNNDAEAMVVIEEGFEEGLQNGELEDIITIIKSPSTYSAELVKEIVVMEALRIYSGDFTYEWVNNSLKENGKNTSITREEVLSRVEAYWQPQPIMTITYEEVEANPQSGTSITVPSFTAASLGLMVLFIMMGLLFGSGWLCEEKSNGTLQRILSIKGAARPLFLGNVAALFTMGLTLTLIFVTVQRFLFNVTLLRGITSWLVISLYILCAASLSMLMAAFFETPHQLQAFVPVFALITGLMGGCLWNLLGVPKSLLTMALFTPQGWALQALTGLYAAPTEIGLAVPAILILLGGSIVFLSIAYRSLLKAGSTSGN